MNRILLISHIFPPAVDGGSRVIYKLGKQLEKRGHTTLYLSSNCSSTDEFVKKQTTCSNILNTQQSNTLKLPIFTIFSKPLKLVNLFIPQKTYIYQLLKVFQKGPIFKFLPLLKAIIKIIKFKPDIIITGPLPTTIVLYSHFIKSLLKIITRQKPKILINSSFHPTDPDFQLSPLIKSLKKADYLWTLTQFETNYFIKNFKINRNKLILAGNGIDSHFLIKKSPRYHQHPVILFIGSLSAHKRVDLLLKSFSLLSKNNLFQARLIIAGQKTLFYPQIKKTYNSLQPKVKTKIKFMFNFKQSKLANLIDNCTLLVLPSVQESFGLVLIESWARKKPVIVSNISPLSELVTKTQGGLIFKQDNQFDLFRQMDKLINSPPSCYQYGQNGFEYVKTNYTWEKVSQKICSKIKLSG